MVSCSILAHSLSGKFHLTLYQSPLKICNPNIFNPLFLTEIFHMKQWICICVDCQICINHSVIVNCGYIIKCTTIVHRVKTHTFIQNTTRKNIIRDKYKKLSTHYTRFTSKWFKVQGSLQEIMKRNKNDEQRAKTSK